MADRAALHRLLLLLAAVACFALAQMLEGCVSETPAQPLMSHTAVATGELGLWEHAHGPLRQCRAELPSLSWESQPQDIVDERCGSEVQLEGCFSYEGPMPSTPTISYVDALRTDDMWYRLWRHELCHWVLHCSHIDDSGDPEHDGPWASICPGWK